MKNTLIRKNVNIDKPNIIPIFILKELDDAILPLSLFKNSTAFDITDQTVTLGAKTSTGLIEQKDGFTINKSQLDIVLKNSILVPGIVEIDLNFKDANGQMTSASFFISVTAKVLNDDAVEATNEFDTFTKTVENIEADYDTLKGGLLANDKVVYFQNEINKTNASLDSITRNKLNALDYGAKGDYSTNDYDALKNLFIESNSHLINDSTLGSNPFFKCTIEIPNGFYVVSQADLFNGVFSQRITRLKINGNNATIVLKDFEGALLYNSDKLMNVDIYNLNFVSMNDIYSSKRTILNSFSDGGAQGFRFHQCAFEGYLQYGINLIGTNNNSEFLFNQCAFRGTWEAFLNIGNSNTSDQFLNYWFNNCKYLSSSTWISAYKGGHFKLTNCDASGYLPTTVETYLFKLYGGTHSSGVTTFIDNGTRYELKSEFAKVMYCEWDTARVSFENCDMGSNSLNIVRDNVFYFKSSVNIGSRILYSFINCTLQGKFKIESGLNNFLSMLKLQNCLLLGDSTTTKINDVFNAVKGSNSSYFTKIKLSEVSFNGEIYSFTYNGLYHANALLDNKATTKLSPFNTLQDTWTKTINQATYVDEIIIINNFANISNNFKYSIKSDIDTVRQIYTNAIGYNGSYNFYVGQQITIGSSNTIYTITALSGTSKNITVDKNIESGVLVGDTISFVLADNDVVTNSNMKIKLYNTKYIVINDLYLKSYGEAFPVGGIANKIIIKTLE